MAYDPEQQLDLLTETMSAARARRILGIPEEQIDADIPELLPVAETAHIAPPRHRRRPRREVQPTENEADPNWNIQRTAREALDAPLMHKGPGYLAAMAMGKAIGAKDVKAQEEIYREIVGSENPDDKVA